MRQNWRNVSWSLLDWKRGKGGLRKDMLAGEEGRRTRVGTMCLVHVGRWPCPTHAWVGVLQGSCGGRRGVWAPVGQGSEGSTGRVCRRGWKRCMKHRHLRCFRCSGAALGPEDRKLDCGCGLKPCVLGGPWGEVGTPGRVGPTVGALR